MTEHPANKPHPGIIRAVLVDDHDVVRAGFAHLLGTVPGIRVVADFNSAEPALAFLETNDTDIIVTDLSMPGMNGIEAIGRIHERHPAVKILALTVHESESLVHRAMQAGASGYLSKRCRPEELIVAVQEIALGRKYLGNEISRQLALRKVDGQSHVTELLAPREQEVFSMLAQGMSVVEIAAALGLSPKTVHVHRANILRKLEITSIAALVQIAIRDGVIEPPL